MEEEPNIDNVIYLDEYPDLTKRVWLRRVSQERIAKIACTGIILEFPTPPDDAA